jgi:tetratricopeptide (TPR) repeat protein
VSASETVFISYSHDSHSHSERVYALAMDLKSLGLNVVIDQDENHGQQWPAWMVQQIQRAKVVLTVCTSMYRRRFEDTEGGAGWEGAILTNILYKQKGVNEKVVPVVFSAADLDHIPLPLQGYTYYNVGDEKGRRALRSKLAKSLSATPKLLPARVRTPLQVDEDAGRVIHAGGHEVPFLVPPHTQEVLVPRTQVLDRLQRSLLAGGIHVLRGKAGVGKTALAMAVVRDTALLEHFYDGVLWASLGPSQRAEARIALWATALGVPVSGSTRPDNSELRLKLASKRMLLVVDDAWTEDAVRPFVELFDPAGKSALLITTRQDDHFLSVSRAGDNFLAAAATAVEVPAFSEAEGFMMLELSLSATASESHEALRQVLHLTAGLPLALRLAGSYIRATAHANPGSAIPACIDKLSTLIQREQADAIRSGERPGVAGYEPIELRAAIALCYAALGKDSQRALRMLTALSPKPNSFSDAAARRIAAPRGEEALPEETFQALLAFGLLERSGSGRCTMHQAVREAAANRAPAREKPPHKQMINFYVAFAQDHPKEFRLLRLELRNFLTALHVASDEGMTPHLIKALKAFYPVFEVQGLFALPDIHGYLLKASQEAPTADDRADMMVLLARRAEKLGEYGTAEGCVSASLDILRKGTRIAQRVEALYVLAVVTFNRCDYEAADGHLKEAYEKVGALGHEQSCRLLERMTLVDFYRGDREQAARHARDAIAILKRLDFGNSVLWALLHLQLGRIALVGDNFAEAERCAAEGLGAADAHAMGPEVTAALLQVRSRVLMESGDLTEAEAVLRRALDMVERIRHRWYMAFLGYELGKLLLRKSEFAGAAVQFDRVAEIGREIGSNDFFAFGLLGNARLAEAQGRSEEAVRLMSQVIAFFDVSGHFKRREALAFQAAVLLSLGRRYMEEGRLDQARERYQAAAHAAKASGNLQQQADALHRVAEVFLALAQAAGQVPEPPESVARRGMRLADPSVEPTR